MTGIYPISPDYQIYLRNTIIYDNIYDNKVYFFAKPRGGCEPSIPGTNLFSFSAADSGWLDIELVSISPNAGTMYEVYDNTDVGVKFKTEYGASFGENLTVNFEKGEVLTANDRNLEYTWHTPEIVNGNEDTSKITVSYGPVIQEFNITIRDPLPIAVFVYNPSSPQTGDEVHFNASDSTDIDGGISSYQWNFGDGNVGEGEDVSHEFNERGTYNVTLTVTDDNEQIAQISQNITVKAAPPIADFKLLDPSPEWDTRTRFDGSLSSDVDGYIVSYQWDFGDGNVGEGEDVSHEFNERGTYNVTLTVTDDQNLSKSKTILIVIGRVLSYENKGDIGIPAALAGGNMVDYQITVITGDCDDAGTDSTVYIALYGSERYNGRYGSRESMVCASVPFEKGSKDTFKVSGYNLEEIEFITLRHENNLNKPGWYVKEIKIKNENGKEWLFVPDQWLAMLEPPEYQTWGKFVPVERPVAAFTYSPTNPFVGEPVSFDSSGSSDPNGTIVSYNWDFGDETSPGTEVTNNHQFQKKGVHKVTLTVTDDEGVSGTTTKSFMVKKNLIGHTKAILESPISSTVDVWLSYESEDSINILQSDIGTTPHFHVDWKIKDNSRTVGYSLYVSSELESFNFSTWNWVTGGADCSKSGQNKRWGKYNLSGTWSLDPFQPNPVTKYKLTLTGKSRNKSKEKSEEFYAALPIPEDFNSSFAARTAAPNWIAGRYELALIFRAMSQHWKNIKNSSLSEENYREETERILGSTHCLFGSTTATGCATNLGLNFLGVAANFASNAAFSGATAVAGPANTAYTYITWAIDTLSWSADHWDEIFDDYKIGLATNTATENNLESSLEKSLDELFPAILEEADESMNFIYNDGWVNDWYAKLQTENTKLGKVAEKALVAYNNAEPILNPFNIEDFEHEVLEFLEFIIKMANFQTKILGEVISD
jgi:PKD repeat protein